MLGTGVHADGERQEQRRRRAAARQPGQRADDDAEHRAGEDDADQHVGIEQDAMPPAETRLMRRRPAQKSQLAEEAARQRDAEARLMKTK